MAEGEMQMLELPDRFVFFTRRHDPALSIDRASGVASLVDGDLPPDNELTSRCTVYGVLGAIRLATSTHYLVITGRTCLGTYRNAPIFKVSSMRALECTPHPRGSARGREEAYLVDLLQIVVDTPGLLFSYGVDLTNNAQRTYHLGDANKSLHLWKQADTRFVWNSHLMEALLEAKAEAYALPVVQGSFQAVDILLGQKRSKLTLISRRCTRRPGTRMWRRGADADGSVANFVETEQLLEVDDLSASYVQVRGSIPVFWEQVVDLSYKPTIRAIKHEETSRAVQRHFQDLSRSYSSVLAVDLINQQGSESVLSVAYRTAMDNLQVGSVRYVPFDFHRICGHIHFERLVSLHEQIEEDLLKQRYFLIRSNEELIDLQAGVVRSNCVDCLDRTNVTQSLLGRKALEEQLRRIGLFQAGMSIAQHPALDAQFNILWANHGDDISIQYSGTLALKGDFVRYGKRSFRGLLQDAISSLRRYYLNNFKDGYRQDAMELVAGYYDPSQRYQLGSLELAAYFPFIAAIVVACLLATVLSFWRVTRGQDSILFTALWATIAVSLGAAVRMNGRQLCSRPRLKRSH